LAGGLGDCEDEQEEQKDAASEQEPALNFSASGGVLHGDFDEAKRGEGDHRRLAAKEQMEQDRQGRQRKGEERGGEEEGHGKSDFALEKSVVTMWVVKEKMS
jgi:hypothetical protein